MLYLFYFYILKIKYVKANNLINNKLVNLNQIKERKKRTIQLHLMINFL